MKSRANSIAMILFAAVISLAAASRACGQAVTPLPLRQGEISFALRATKVNDFVGRVNVLRAEFEGRELSGIRGLLEWRVADMHTGIGLRDTHMRHALSADRFPTIRFDLTGVEPGASRGDTVAVAFKGNLTIRGVTRPLNVPGSVVLRPDAIDVTASAPIDMRDYGIEPPSRFFGAIKVKPVTTVTATLRFARS